MKALNLGIPRRVWLPAAACVGLFALMVILINPLHNFPIGDDWEYARSVERLLATGQFYRSPMVQATVFAHVLWGALFARVMGFSFISLRLSTLPLAALALAAFYGVLGQLGFSLGQRLLGTLTLMVAPLFVFYTHTFNTEVPFLSWLLLGLWCTLRGLRLGRLRWVLAGSVFAAVAFLTRQIGLALPAAAALVVAGYQPRERWPAWLAACLALPALAAAGFYGWQALAHQSSWADMAITDQGTLQFVLSQEFAAAAARRVVLIVVTLALYMLPLWLAFLPGWRAGWQALRGLSPRLKAAAALLALFLVSSVLYFGLRGEWWPYYQESLTSAGLGPSLALFAYPYDQRTPFLPMPVWISMSFVGALLGAALLLVPLVRLARVGRDRPQWRVAWQVFGPAHSLVAVLALMLLAAVLVFPIVYARYFLPLLPLAIILLLEAGRRLRPSPVLGPAGLLFAGLLSVGLMWDSWSWHEVRWAECQALVAQGVSLERLDAGYEWNGWHLSDEVYALLEDGNLPAAVDPWKVIIDPQYMVTFSVVPGYRVKETWPFATPLRAGGQDRLLLLERVAATQ